MNKPALALSKRDIASLAHHRMDLIFSLLRTAIITSGCVAAVYFLPAVVTPFAGRDTALALYVAIFGDIKFALSIGLTGCMAAWAAVERSIRHRKVEYLQGRIKQLETTIDHGRTGSRLTPKGKTNPEDKL